MSVSAKKRVVPITEGTNFTLQVKTLLNKIYGTNIQKDGLLEGAIAFYKQDIARQDISTFYHKMNKQTQKQISDARLLRYQHLYNLCHDIIQLSEGETDEETKRKSAQLLGTIQLLSATSGDNVAVHNERNKPLYKAILTMRLLDQLFYEKILSSHYIQNILKKHYGEDFLVSATATLDLIEDIKIPVLMAVLIQDIGNYHPKAQIIMKGVEGDKDAFRVLSMDERKSLLQINYTETLNFLVNGIGGNRYVGNSKEERHVFLQNEKNKLLLIKYLLKSSVQPKKGIGNIIKIPQIYASIVLSTKRNYNYELIPKVYSALYQNVEKGFCRKDIVDLLRKITGDFPQGYGVCYTPAEGVSNVKHEYAIVTHLYPKNAEEPVCRTVTRKLTFIAFGQDIVVKKSSNFHYLTTQQKLTRVSQERLNEIYSLLASNAQERQVAGAAPRCWHPEEYFSDLKNQKLWNKVIPKE